MRVNGLDHINIRTRDVAESARFYADLLDMKIANSPANPPTQSRWLCDSDGRAVIHLRLFDCAPGPTGAIDHVALSCSGKTELLKRLKSRNLQFAVHEGVVDGLCQIFVRDPHGVMLELDVFDA